MWPTAIEDHPPPEVLRDLDTAARVLDELDGRGVEITLALDEAGRLHICAVDDDGRLHRPATTALLDMLVAPGRHWLTLNERG
jgi:hypothetical protein